MERNYHAVSPERDGELGSRQFYEEEGLKLRTFEKWYWRLRNLK